MPRTSRRGWLVLVATLALLLAAGPAYPADTSAFDTGPTSWEGYYTGVSPTVPQSQTFVATASGSLTRLSVLMNKRAMSLVNESYSDICATYAWQPLTVTLHPAATDNSSIDYGTVLATSEIAPSDVPCTTNARGDGFPPTDVVFLQPATMAAGGHYAVAFRGSGGYQLALGLNAYTDGEFWSGAQRYPSFPPYAYDLVLHGYVAAVDSTPPSLSVSHSGDGLGLEHERERLARYRRERWRQRPRECSQLY